ncbi:MAG: MOSC domain-containing protein [Gammaproteobacteria bacterium]|nr:MAG: MOSC domain-containing protein [Gammaproteobacteria bacterium]
MKIISLNVSMARTVQYKGQDVATGIYKSAVSGPRMVRRLNIDGDEQADLKLHGGEHKAVYAFPSEHYSFYEKALNKGPYEPGQFGENLTTEGMLEPEVRIGNRYRVGEVRLEVSQPRFPGYKFGLRMEAAEATMIYIKSMKTGFYLRVLNEGEIQAGDVIKLEFENVRAPTVEAVHKLYYFGKNNIPAMRHAAQCESLGREFRDEFENRIHDLEAKVRQ